MKKTKRETTKYPFSIKSLKEFVLRNRLILLLMMLCLLAPALVCAEFMPDDIPLPESTEGPQPASEEQAEQTGGMLEEGGLLYLVNRDRRARAAYKPADLVVPKVATRKKNMEERIMLRADAARALEEMFAAAKREKKYILYAVSGFRSYGIQQILFNGKVQDVGRERALRTVAPPGTSEHQLGLAMDVQSSGFRNLNQNFGDTEEGKWVAENAHRFGFIIRYKQEWRDVTGYADEPWHLRYLGKAHAMAVHTLNIPYEEYHGAISGLPEYVLEGATDLLLAGLARERLMESPPPVPEALLSAFTEEERQEALREATLPYLPEGLAYEKALWAIYPTPKPTAGPRVDEDEETHLSSITGHAVSP